MRTLSEEQKHRTLLIGDQRSFFIAAFLRDTNGSQVIGMDEAGCPPGREARVTPPESNANSLRFVALSVRSRSKYPSYFWHFFERWFNAALEIHKTKVANEAAAFFLFNCPEPETLDSPVTHVPQEPRPNVLGGQRTASKIARNSRIGPHRGTSAEISSPVAAQQQTLCLDNGNFDGKAIKNVHKFSQLVVCRVQIGDKRAHSASTEPRRKKP